MIYWHINMTTPDTLQSISKISNEWMNNILNAKKQVSMKVLFKIHLKLKTGGPTGWSCFIWSNFDLKLDQPVILLQKNKLNCKFPYKTKKDDEDEIFMALQRHMTLTLRLYFNPTQTDIWRWVVVVFICLVRYWGRSVFS